MKNFIMKFTIPVLVMFAIIILPYETSSKSKIAFGTVTKIIYRFTDSSVPPQYHRSYTLIVTENKVNVKVDSYGEILKEKEIDIDSNQFDFIKKSILKNKIRKRKKLESKGCTGGTSDQIEYFNKEKKLLSAYVYHCGNKDYGDLRGDIKKVANDMKSLIPDFKDLLK